MTYFNGVAEQVEDLIPLIDKLGGPETFPHMAAGWAVAFDTPLVRRLDSRARSTRSPSRWVRRSKRTTVSAHTSLQLDS